MGLFTAKKFHFFQINFVTHSGERIVAYHQSKDNFMTPTRVQAAAGRLGLSIHLMPENIIYYGYMTEKEWNEK